MGFISEIFIEKYGFIEKISQEKFVKVLWSETLYTNFCYVDHCVKKVFEFDMNQT